MNHGKSKTAKRVAKKKGLKIKNVKMTAPLTVADFLGLPVVYPVDELQRCDEHMQQAIVEMVENKKI
jgi:hypothetical protein